MEEVKKRGRKQGFTHSPETRAQMSQSHMGKRFTKEHRQNISEAKKSAPHHFRGTTGPFYGRTHSAEAREKISWTHKGKVMSPESRAKLKESLAQVERLHCPYCHGMFSPPLFSRWHGEKCKHKI